MPAVDAAERWRQTWETGWPRRDVEAIVALYAPSATYRAHAFRRADEGVDGVRRYLRENFDAESDISWRFGQPLVSGSRAAVEWWASWIEDGQRLTMAGTTLLRFDDEGMVVDHRDYWNQQPGRAEPYPEW
jgi:SnoaL-like domain